MALVTPKFGIEERSQWPNSCSVNRYTDGYACLPWHSDDEPIFVDDEYGSRILSLSLGTARVMQFSKKATSNDRR
eukprot:949182-Karenia_brevis.AAC.1